MLRVKVLPLVLVGVIIQLAVERPASARKGRLTPGHNGPSTASMGVDLTFPPTQEDLGSISEKLIRASRMFCDATDGAIQVNRFYITQGGLDAERTDVLWYPTRTRSAIRALSRARAAYFATDHGQARYLELERSLEAAAQGNP